MPSRFDDKPTALDLFSGVGGLSLGLTQAGFRLLGGADIDGKAVDAHRANFPDSLSRQCDLFGISGSELRGVFNLGCAPIDLLAGGPPCQGFSAGGVRVKADPRNQGVAAFARLVAEVRPRYFLMENVRGFLFRDHQAVRDRFRRVVEKAGYEALPFRLLDAAGHGVPQRRLRAFVLGWLKSERPAAYPEPGAGPAPTVRDAISDLAPLDRRSDREDEDVCYCPLGEPSPYSARLRVRPSGKEGSGLTGCRTTRHSPVVVARFEATPPGRQEPVSRFYRALLGWRQPHDPRGHGAGTWQPHRPPPHPPRESSLHHR